MSVFRIWVTLTAVSLAGCASTASERQIIPVGDADYRVETAGPLRNTYPVPVRETPFEPEGQSSFVTQDMVARQYLAEGQPDAAEQALQEALQVNPFDPAAINNMAVVRSEQGHYYEAIELLERASRLSPDDPEIAANLARLRHWVQAYGMSASDPYGVVPHPNDGVPTLNRPNVPPPAPPLWNAQPVRY
ncbi:tetratricopeptide repeat protein [Polycyclovorans algicola]|uniref:tetratricopeptide repeat protein n=1 Tax=Polycyclovorans algicola TaxID=616992 RepID=UPI0004A775EE|nr:tetratricopeptide repeat protein [Polycyclovorans algicola]